ncbi:hypothetical protein BGZ76_010786 [Entomortierella beljakovae]|nr:hypothetical protein BGZ76_010786 [Entomortierella beljakovae]
MRNHIVGKPGRDLRQTYMQQYLKQFLRRVHPDLFQNFPKEQLRNSNSLQDLLPLVNSEKDTKSSIRSHPSNSWKEGDHAKLVFYLKPNKPEGNSKTDVRNPTQLESIEHSLPIIAPLNQSTEDYGDYKQKVMEQEIKSWQMVQSFLDLCRKVGVSVKEADHAEIANHLTLSEQDLTAKRGAVRQQRQKPLSEVFQEELQSSFSGSSGYQTNKEKESSGGGISRTYLGKIGGTVPILDAEVMIKSNPLLFKSPNISSSRQSKIIRTWIHWQNEDQQPIESKGNDGPPQIPFELSSWWRKVPIMILDSAMEREQVLKSTNFDKNGMLIVDQDMSKQDMTEYLWNNLERIQSEYKDKLQTSQRLNLDNNNDGRVQYGSDSSLSVPEIDTATYIERISKAADLGKVNKSGQLEYARSSLWTNIMVVTRTRVDPDACDESANE